MNPDFLDIVRALSAAEIIKNKKATGRPKDLADLDGLESG